MKFFLTIDAFLLTLFLFASVALAGPPQVCHVFDIGTAQSLAWSSHDWNLTGSESYDTKNLAADTVAILDNTPAVLVHMETLRRATLYAQKDAVAANQLLLKLLARSNSAVNTSSSAFNSFDLGYLVETMKQYAWIKKEARDPAQGFDGYALIQKALLLGGNDPEMEFAAALITLNAPGSEHQEYAQRALAGAKNDALLARNLAAHSHGPQSETMAEMISETRNLKLALQ